MSERRSLGIPVRAEPSAGLAAPERAAVLESIEQHRQLAGNLLPILHGIQDRLGWVPPRAVPLIAFELNLSRAEVHGVLSFYHYFRHSKPGRQVIYLCRAEACQAVGAAALEAHAKRKLGVDFHGTSARRPLHARAGVLPRQLRLRAVADDRQGTARPRYAGALR